MDPSDLKKRTLHSVLWTVARIGSANLLGSVVFFALARILSPAEFGTYALAGVMLEFFRIAATAGLEEAVTQVRVLDEELAAAAFWANVALSVAAAGAMWAIARPYARLIGSTDLAAVLQSLSVLVPIYALGGMHVMRKLREFGHRSIAGLTLATNLVGGGGAILAALHGWGVWSLVVQAFITEILGLAFKWRAFPWCPRPRFSLRRLHEIGGFGTGITLALLLRMMLARVQDVIIGAFLNTAAVGVYRVAWRILELISQLTVHPVMTVSLITLARLQDDRKAFANAYGRMLGLAAMFALPAITGFGMLSNDVIALLFGPQWAGAAPIATILSLMATPYLLSFFVAPTLSAAGRSRASVEVAGVQFVVSGAMSLIAAPFGLAAVAISFVFQAYVNLPYQLHVLRRETGITAAIVARSVLPSIWGSLFMAAVLFAFRFATPFGPAHLLSLTIGVVVGVIAYLVGLALFGGGFLTSQYRAIRPLLMPAAGSSGTG